jgi:hypothetical protein
MAAEVAARRAVRVHLRHRTLTSALPQSPGCGTAGRHWSATPVDHLLQRLRAVSRQPQCPSREPQIKDGKSTIKIRNEKSGRMTIRSRWAYIAVTPGRD